MLKTKQVNAPSFQRLADFQPESFNEERNTIDVVWSTGARVKRSPWFDEPYMEELGMDRKNVRLDRLNAGASVLSNHNAYDLRSVLGVVEKARLEDGKGVATLRLSKREDIKPIVEDIKNGIIRNVSVGYRIHKLEKQSESNDGLAVYRVTDWEPFEISFVTIPADAGAQVRSDNGNVCELIFRGETEMKDALGAAPAGATGEHKNAPAVDEAKIRAEAAAAERARCEEIRTTCAKHGLDEAFAKRLVDGNSTIEAARKEILDELAKRDADKSTRTPNVSVTRDEADTRRNGMEEALMHRADSNKNKLTDLGRMYRKLSLTDMIRICLESAGHKTSMMSREEIVRTMLDLRVRSSGMHSSSDFPLLLENVMNKTLRNAYQSAPASWQPFTRQVTVPDFKQVSRVQLGDAPSLELKAENGPITAGTMSESAEKYKIDTYAKMVRIGREALINDDLDAFTRLPAAFGRRAAEKEADLVFAVLMSNAALSDSIALFHATHGNLNAGGAAAINVTSIGAARSAMRKQKGLNGERIMVTPSYLLVPPELETVAQQFVSQALLAEQSGNINPFAGRLQVLVEPRLSDSSFNGGTGVDTNGWYLTADVGQIDIIELARLAGEEGPVIEREELFDVEGVKIKCRIDLGAKAIDYRGLQKNDGA